MTCSKAAPFSPFSLSIPGPACPWSCRPAALKTVSPTRGLRNNQGPTFQAVPRMTLSTPIIQAFTPTGKLRAAINLGNPILAKLDAASGQPVGVSSDLARGFAGLLGATA